MNRIVRLLSVLMAMAAPLAGAAQAEGGRKVLALSAPVTRQQQRRIRRARTQGHQCLLTRTGPTQNSEAGPGDGWARRITPEAHGQAHPAGQRS